MARLNIHVGNGQVLALLWSGPARLQWLLRAGGWRLCGALLVLSALLGALLWQHQQAQRAQLQTMVAQQQAALHAVSSAALAGAAEPDERSRLTAFEQLLLPHADIPLVVEEVLQLAAKSGLLVQRGDYRAQTDVAGGFLRYGMTLPVSGEAAAVERFMQTALRRHPMLLLDSWRLQRQQGQPGRIDARLQWVILTHLPPPAGPVATTSKAAP